LNQRIAVIGGGPSGTTAAHTLNQKGYDVTIIEKDDRLGGRICSVKLGEQSFEMGAGFVTTGLYPNTFSFLEASGLKSDLHYRKSNGAVVRGGKPQTAKSLLGNGWLPLAAKLLAIKQVLKVIPAWRSLSIKQMEDAAKFDSRSVSDELNGKAGKTLLEYLVQPLLNSYLYWRPEQTSQAMLTVLTRTSFHKGRTYTLKHGLQQIPETLAAGCTILLNTEVQNVTSKQDGLYELTIKDSEPLLVNGVVCTTTASVALKIIGDLNAVQKSFLSGIAYSKTVVVANTYKQSKDLPNFELAYPRAEAKPMTAITMQTIADGDGGYDRVVKAFASGEIAEKLLTANDDEVDKQLTLTDLALPHVGSNKASHSRFIKRWHEALPIFNVGYFKRLKGFKENEKQSRKALVFAGDYIGGPYIEGAITSGIEAGEQLHLRLS
jgi:oxygen-dependent protoporphyrinogen oxidase